MKLKILSLLALSLFSAVTQAHEVATRVYGQDVSGTTQVVHAAQLYTYVYRMTVYSPSKGKLGEREVALVAGSFKDAEFQIVFVRSSFLKELAGSEIGGTVTSELITIR